MRNVPGSTGRVVKLTSSRLHRVTTSNGPVNARLFMHVLPLLRIVAPMVDPMPTDSRQSVPVRWARSAAAPGSRPPSRKPAASSLEPSTQTDPATPACFLGSWSRQTGTSPQHSRPMRSRTTGNGITPGGSSTPDMRYRPSSQASPELTWARNGTDSPGGSSSSRSTSSIMVRARGSPAAT